MDRTTSLGDESIAAALEEVGLFEPPDISRYLTDLERDTIGHQIIKRIFGNPNHEVRLVGLDRIAEWASPSAKQFAAEINRQFGVGTTWGIVFHRIRDLLRIGKLTATIERDYDGKATDVIVAIPAPVRAAQQETPADGAPS